MESTKSVTQNLPETEWDAIVIGSGLNGLSCAVSMAKDGKRVLVLEQHFIPGGYATCFKRKDFTFEVSLHATSDLGKGEPLNQLLDNLGVLKKIIPIRMNETVLLRTEAGDFTIGAGFISQLKKVFPHEAEGLEKLDNLIDKLLKEVEFFMKNPVKKLTLVNKLTVPNLKKYSSMTLGECLDDYLQDPFLKQIFSAQWGFYGLPKDKVCALIYLLDVGSFIKRGSYYIKGTSQSLSNAFVERLKELGGRIILNQRVSKIIVENGKAVGVISKDALGKSDKKYEFRAPIIISNADPYATYKLTGHEHIPLPERNKLDMYEASASTTVAYIGLDCPLSRITNEQYHSISFIDKGISSETEFQRILNGELAGMCITDYSNMDPELAPHGKAVITLLCLDFMDNWENMSREDYKAKKEKKLADMIELAEKYIPGFRAHIEYKELATPLTSKRYTGNCNGSFNGFAYTVKRVGMLDGGISTKTSVKGLYLCSAWGGEVSGGFKFSIMNGFMKSKMIGRF